MPPKAGRKRARESTGTAGKAATASSSSAPGSAPPASRRTRSNSATSQQEDGDGDNAVPRASKRSRRGGASDRDSDSNGDVDMGEPAGPAIANGPAAAVAAAKKGSRRKSTSAVVANGEVRCGIAHSMVACETDLGGGCLFAEEQCMWRMAGLSSARQTMTTRSFVHVSPLFGTPTATAASNKGSL